MLSREELNSKKEMYLEQLSELRNQDPLQAVAPQVEEYQRDLVAKFEASRKSDEIKLVSYVELIDALISDIDAKQGVCADEPVIADEPVVDVEAV